MAVFTGFSEDFDKKERVKFFVLKGVRRKKFCISPENDSKV